MINLIYALICILVYLIALWSTMKLFSLVPQLRVLTHDSNLSNEALIAGFVLLALAETYLIMHWILNPYYFSY